MKHIKTIIMLSYLAICIISVVSFWFFMGFDGIILVYPITFLLLPLIAIVLSTVLGYFECQNNCRSISGEFSEDRLMISDKTKWGTTLFFSVLNGVVWLATSGGFIAGGLYLCLIAAMINAVATSTGLFFGVRLRQHIVEKQGRAKEQF